MVTFDRKRCRRMKKTEHNRDSHHDQQQNHAHCLRERAHWSVLLENRKTITFEKPTPPRQWSLKNDLSTFVIVFRYINSMLRGTIVLTRVLFIQTLTLLSGPEFNRYEERSPYTHAQANVYICTHTCLVVDVNRLLSISSYLCTVGEAAPSLSIVGGVSFLFLLSSLLVFLLPYVRLPKPENY